MQDIPADDIEPEPKYKIKICRFNYHDIPIMEVFGKFVYSNLTYQPGYFLQFLPHLYRRFLLISEQTPARCPPQKGIFWFLLHLINSLVRIVVTFIHNKQRRFMTALYKEPYSLRLPFLEDCAVAHNTKL